MTRVTVLFLLLSAAPALADSSGEVTALASFTTAADIGQTAVGVRDLQFAHGLTWGWQAGYFFSSHWGIEALMMQQSAPVTMTTPGGSAELFKTRINDYHGDVVYQFGASGRRLRPFVFGGAGATFFEADDLDGAGKFSWTVGGGVKWLPRRHFGVRLHGRYKPVELHDGSAPTCGPFGFCQNSLSHFEVGAGAMIRY